MPTVRDCACPWKGRCMGQLLHEWCGLYEGPYLRRTDMATIHWIDPENTDMTICGEVVSLLTQGRATSNQTPVNCPKCIPKLYDPALKRITKK